MRTKIAKGNTKIGNVWNVSLTPGKSCGDVPCKRDCYAMKSWKMYPNVRAAWGGNLQLAETDRSAYFESIRDQLSAARTLPSLFRWHIAGDILDSDYVEDMAETAEMFPSVKFLAFTKNHAAVNEWLDIAGLPANLSIVFSAWPGMRMENPHGLPVAWMQDGTETRIPENALECIGRCDTCGMCWQLAEIGREVYFVKH